jgi:hypothetical protein
MSMIQRWLNWPRIVLGDFITWMLVEDETDTAP